MGLKHIETNLQGTYLMFYKWSLYSDCLDPVGIGPETMDRISTEPIFTDVESENNLCMDPLK